MISTRKDLNRTFQGFQGYVISLFLQSSAIAPFPKTKKDTTFQNNLFFVSYGVTAAGAPPPNYGRNLAENQVYHKIS